MTKGSKVFRPTDVPESNSSSYPEPFREGQRKRFNRRLGDHAGLKNYGVNLIRVLPRRPVVGPSRAFEAG
jgi:uncharacterized cupin superfamily protein